MNDAINESNAPSKRVPLKIIVLLVILMIGGMGAYLAPKIYRKIRTEKAEKIVAQAEELLDRDNAPEAFRLLTKHYSQNPNEPAYLRAIAKFLKRAGAEPDKSLHFWKQLSNTGTATYDDLVEFGINLCQSNDAGEARRVYESLSDEDKQKNRSLELLAYILQAEGKTSEAELLLRRALSQDKEDTESRFKLARIELRNPFTEVQSKAYEEMWDIARTDTRTSIAAIETLANDPKLTSLQSEELMRLVEKNPRSTERIRYIVLQSYVNLNPSTQKAVVDAEFKRNQNRPIDSLFDYYRWLFLLKEYDLLLKIMPPERAIKIREMFPIYVEVLAAKDQWKDIQNLLRNNPTIPASPTDLALLRARCAKALKEPEENVRGHLIEACRAALATRDMNNFNRTTLLTERLGYEDVAIDAFKKASELPQYKLMMLERIYRMHIEKKNTISAYQTAKELVAAKPDSADFQEKLIYLSLLIGFEMELSHHELQNSEIFRSASFKTTAFIKALVAYRQSDIEQLKGILPTIRIEDLNGGQKAVVAGLMSIAGQVSEGFGLAEKLTALSLLDEEQHFLKIAL